MCVLFAMRFLGAHLSDRNRAALTSLALAKDYEASLRRVAEEGAAGICESNRWRLGWVSYKAAADENTHLLLIPDRQGRTAARNDLPKRPAGQSSRAA